MRPTRFRWCVIFLLFAITAVNYIDRAAISYAIPVIQRELGFSATESGAILGAFGLGYALTTLLGGFAVDRWGARIVLTIAAVLWSLSIGLTALATGVAMSNPGLIDQIARESSAVVGPRLYSDALSGPGGPAPTYEAMMRHNVTALVAGMMKN